MDHASDDGKPSWVSCRRPTRVRIDRFTIVNATDCVHPAVHVTMHNHTTVVLWSSAGQSLLQLGACSMRHISKLRDYTDSSIPKSIIRRVGGNKCISFGRNMVSRPDRIHPPCGTRATLRSTS